MDKVLKLQEALHAGKLSHALLLESAVGSQNFLEPFFRSFLCLKDEVQPCGTCDSCRTNLNLNGEDNRQHPDFWFTQPQSETGYTVEQVRDWGAKFLHLSKNLSKRKLLVIDQAEKLGGTQQISANAMLKILEEPRAGTYLVLLTHKPYKLLSTIRSRCMKISLKLETAHYMQDQVESLANEESVFSEILDVLNCNFKSGGRSNLSNSFWWKERALRISELERMHSGLWQAVRGSVERGDSDLANRLWSHWRHFEDFLVALKLYGNPPLHWLNFKRKVKGESPWRTSKLFG